MRRKNFFSKSIPLKILFLLLFLCLVVSITAISKMAPKRYKINKEIYNLKKEIGELEKQNNEITQLIEYLNTLSFKEKEARIKLGLQKEGEKTIIITSPYSELNSEKAELLNEKESPSSNIFKWWKYFFNNGN